ncbi:hypothetical protein BGP77_01550 [Saccharospirillum sp. MSK14-1]|uniref:phosphotransferase n=1 Tax=Saccharospirillum sp. MSK14-1 TaxID=1897632 RepID=UPI000D3A42E5|nr:phosphotransferase [Saccharospirillum sp. MSK14-1]PTY36034.1 hypothetical protein BGP77_01550 [Saccharospirillum sp. MSK14-1]
MELALFQALEQVGERLPNALAAERWPGGLCNRLFRVTTDTGHYALRLNHPDSERLGIDRQREQQLLITLADQPWAPTPLSVQDHWLLTPWYDGASPAQGAHTDLAWLTTALMAVQSIEISGEPLNIADQIRHLHDYPNTLPPAFSQAVLKHCNDYQLPAQLTLCHHDWHPGNLAVTESGWVLLDWEFAALGDPAMDLAAVCSGFDLSEAQSLQLADVLDIRNDRLQQARAMMSALAIVWYSANPGLAPAGAPDADDWLVRWG